MRVLALLLVLLLGCARPNVASPTRTSTQQVVSVRVTGCLPIYQEWVREELGSLADLDPRVVWRAAAETASATVEVRCSDSPPNDRWAGWYTLRDPFVQIDPTLIHGEFQFRAAVAHELIHWFIGSYSRHPERGLMHVCWFAYNESAPSGCHPSIVARRAVMMPRLVQQHMHMGRNLRPSVAQYEVTDSDQAFFRWAMGN